MNDYNGAFAASREATTKAVAVARRKEMRPYVESKKSQNDDKNDMGKKPLFFPLAAHY